MKKLLLSVFALVVLVPMASFAYSDGGGEIPLHVSGVPSGGQHRAPALIPLTCYLAESLNSVVLYSSSLTTTADVEISNLSTGDVLSYEDVSISSLPETLPLCGSGEYTIEVTLDNGIIYYGEFNCEY